MAASHLRWDARPCEAPVFGNQPLWGPWNWGFTGGIRSYGDRKIWKGESADTEEGPPHRWMGWSWRGLQEALASQLPKRILTNLKFLLVSSLAPPRLGCQQPGPRLQTVLSAPSVSQFPAAAPPAPAAVCQGLASNPPPGRNVTHHVSQLCVLPPTQSRSSSHAALLQPEALPHQARGPLLLAQRVVVTFPVPNPGLSNFPDCALLCGFTCPEHSACSKPKPSCHEIILTSAYASSAQ